MMAMFESVPVLVWIALGGLALAFLLAGAAYAFFHGMSCYAKSEKLRGVQVNIDAAEKRLAGLAQELEGLRSGVSNAKQAIADGEEMKKWLGQHKAEVEGKQSTLERLNRQITEQSKRNGEWTEKNQKLGEEIQKKEKKRNELEIAVDAADKRMLAQEIEEKRLKKEIEADKGLIAKKEAELEKLQKDAANEAVHAERARKLEEDIQKKEMRLKELNKDLAEIEGRAKAARKMLAEWSFTRGEAQNVWANLEMRVAEAQTRKEFIAGKVDERGWLDGVGRVLGEKGFSFNGRILKAFHTGLKSGEMSPLVVLAGISGTGKSLLPELYAMAAGWHFLPVAVQPRWDSPQDLFGFFNYMEMRYKATELARYLWQLDRYHNKNRESVLNDEALSIVLLDEMNLARVEYYFSDLLSKLELRRGIEPGDEKSRRNAEIELESNGCGAEDKTRRLFVGPDVLFVGTMNEDETTQMLSDKVVDRSNLLRFGKPAQMAGMPDKSQVAEYYRGQPRVTQAVWKRWKEGKDAARFERIARQPLTELNDAFATIGRPFGHRVWQAVRTYLSFYPGNGEADDRAAFADQLEMKILPKLNGLELSADGFAGVREKVQGVIDGLEDPPLSEAFREVSDLNAHAFFKWRGVMR